MIDLWYINTESINEEDLNILLKFVPHEMSGEIMRFRNHTDRRLKLCGKLMVKKYYEDQRMEFNWSNWKVSPHGKPYYNGSKEFSISHSGDYVAVAFSDKKIGIDIEKLTEFDLMSVLDYLHPEEAAYVESASNAEGAFYKVWTRKEAYLKAIGKGIVEGLDNENCLQDELTYNEKWYLHSAPLFSDYQLALCTRIPDFQMAMRELTPVEFYI